MRAREKVSRRIAGRRLCSTLLVTAQRATCKPPQTHAHTTKVLTHTAHSSATRTATTTRSNSTEQQQQQPPEHRPPDDWKDGDGESHVESPHPAKCSIVLHRSLTEVSPRLHPSEYNPGTRDTALGPLQPTAIAPITLGQRDKRLHTRGENSTRWNRPKTRQSHRAQPK